MREFDESGFLTAIVKPFYQMAEVSPISYRGQSQIDEITL